MSKIYSFLKTFFVMYGLQIKEINSTFAGKMIK
ncbi:hypothetical protein PrebiDRAFT_1562 [Prevotella bivia DSM 20514]|uniref:Uncharacterized protein n=1 Tax=Prevotella bivia DSM 20514 TaxID=868129 RepID=I4ZAL5_9BACT|nr:hypothetical protein PrebiDRAFT_1562 [Prevotella bivia DSM 20514]